MGQPTWFYGFYKQPYYADRYFAWIARTKNDEVRKALGSDFAAVVRRTGVQYLIVDGQLHRRMFDAKGINSLRADQVVPFLERQCELVGEIEDSSYGFLDGQSKVTRIYRVRRSSLEK